MANGSNVNLDTALNSGNTGTQKSFPQLGIISAIILVPTSNNVIPASAMVSNAAFLTYVNARFISDTRNGTTPQWFIFNNLDKFSDDTKKTNTEDTGIYQLDVYSFPSKFSFRYMTSMGNNIEANAFKNCQGSYDYFFIDVNGNIWGTLDTTGAGGLMAYTNRQFYVPSWSPATVSTAAQYMINVALASQAQINVNFKVYEANIDPAAIATLQNAFLNDVSSALGTPLTITTTTDIVFTVKYGQDSRDFVQDYQAAITKACFVAKNLTTGATLTISSITMGNIVVAGQNYYYVWAILSAAPTATNLVQISMAAPSVVNALIPNANVVTVVRQAGVNGYNAAVHTF